MSLSTAATNIHILIGKFIALPTLYDEKLQRYIVNPDFRKGRPLKKKGFKFKFWYFMNGAMVAVHCYGIHHLTELLMEAKNSENFSTSSVEETLAYILLIAMTSMCLVTWHTLEHDPRTTCFLSNGLCTTSGIPYAGWPSKRRLPDVEEMAGYIVSIGFFWLPIVNITVPWIVSYAPSSRVLSNFLPELPRKIVASISNMIYSMFGGLCCLTILLQICSGAVDLTKIAKKNLKLSMEAVQQYGNSETLLSKEFRKRLRLHNELVILSEVSNENLGLFIPTLQLIGIVFCVFANLSIVKFYDKVVWILVVWGFAITIGFTSFNLLILGFAAQPNTLSEDTISLWGKVRLGQAEKRQVKCMRVATLRMGTFFSIKKMSGMDVLDDILDYTMTVVTM